MRKQALFVSPKGKKLSQCCKLTTEYLTIINKNSFKILQQNWTSFIFLTTPDKNQFWGPTRCLSHQVKDPCYTSLTNLHFTPGTHVKDEVSNTCNPSTPVVREEAEIEQSP